MFKMDLKKFKKISSDKNSTTMQHDDGHQLTIAHTKLSPKLRAELAGMPVHQVGGSHGEPKSRANKAPAKEDVARMADGGEVEKKAPVSQETWDKFRAGFNAGPQPSPSPEAKKEDGYAKGGEIQSPNNPKLAESKKSPSNIPSFADGGEVPPEAQDATQAQAITAPPEQQTPQVAPPIDPDKARKIELYNLNVAEQGAKSGAPGAETDTSRWTEAGPPQNFYSPAWDSAEKQLATEKTQQAQKAAQTTVAVTNDNAVRARAGLPPNAVPEGAPQPQQQPQGPAEMGNTGQAPAQAPGQDYLSVARGGVKQQELGAREKAAAEKEQYGAEADIRGEQVQQLEGQVTQEKSDQQKGMEELQGFSHDVQNKFIQPNHYMESMGTPAKVTTAIGILLGGIGSGLTGQPNAAMEFLNKQIDRDMAAQEKNLGASQNLLAHNIQIFKDATVARQMTRAMINEGYAHQVEQAQAVSKSDQAKAAADMFIGNLKAQNAFVLSGLNVLPGQGGQGGDQTEAWLNQMRVMAPERAKEVEARYIPGVGIASVPLDNKMREGIIARKGLQDQVANLRQWAKEHTGDLNPADVNYGKALANSVQDAYRQANGQGVFREAEAKFVKGIVEEDPTKFLNKYRVDPKYRALEDSNQLQLNSLLKGAGIKSMPGSQQQGNAGPSKAIPFTPKR